MLIDSHCHLNYKGIIERQADVLSHARSVGVRGMLNISTRECEWDDIINLAEQEQDIWASVGIHPHEADSHPDIDLEKLISRAQHPKVVAIGETGLDYYYDKSDRDNQKNSFRTHIHAAQETGLPIIIHTRDAEDDTADILKQEMARKKFGAVIHCFTASQSFAEIALDIGCYISISGIVTFKNAQSLQESAKIIPLNRLLVETDSPFLAPVPHRGKPCEPAFVADTANFLATLRGEPLDILLKATGQNFFTLFSKAKL
ncbi:LuxR family transcriptional regulator [Sphingorhabdus lutea]|uniref:LuxR family transcriptional regulator n=1 Tax=Sphingorhabdus lutea TaxID=1913578 RepID=A0A1L3JCB7_9SPHN|nr:TatD family hydrolase [Sphingorhabdus lutea]APG62703.1 LuxR family transcriptional regulator [Sphingorhabdus lutea]